MSNVLFPSQTNYLSFGSGSPEGVLAKPPGFLYMDILGGANDSLFIKVSGSGNTGWGAVYTANLAFNPATAALDMDGNDILDVNKINNATGTYIIGDGIGGNLPTLNSDSGNNFITIDTNGTIGRSTSASGRIINGPGAPVNGTTIGWYVGQLYVDTTNDDLYYVSTASTNPDSAATGSVFTAISTSGGSDNLGDGLSPSSDVTAFVLGIRSSDATYDGRLHITAGNSDTGQGTNTHGANISIHGTDHATNADHLDLITGTAGELRVYTGSTPTEVFTIDSLGNIDATATSGANSVNVTTAAGSASATISSVSAANTASIQVVAGSGVALDAGTQSYFLGNGAGGNLPTLDSDSGDQILSIATSDGSIGRLNALTYNTLSGSGAPVNGTTTAYRVGQLYVNTDTGSIYIATSKSTNPDSAATGSVWAVVQYATTSEIATTTATNTFPNTSSTPISGSLKINVKGKVEVEDLTAPSFSVAGSAITWSSSNAGYDVPISTEVEYVYEVA